MDSKDISCILQRYVTCFVVKNIICDWLLQIGEMLLVVYKISEMWLVVSNKWNVIGYSLLNVIGFLNAKSNVIGYCKTFYML